MHAKKMLRKDNVTAAYSNLFKKSLLGQYGYQLLNILYLNYVSHLVSKLIQESHDTLCNMVHASYVETCFLLAITT